MPGRTWGWFENQVARAQSCTLLPTDALDPAAILRLGLVLATGWASKNKGKLQNCDKKGSEKCFDLMLLLQEQKRERNHL